MWGNGGSAADAQHLAAEYLVRLKPKVNRKPLPAISLAQDTSTLTACGNDYTFDDIFLRPFQASKRETHLKTSSSYRAVVDYDVDRTGVEAWQHVKLTVTNSSIGLIYALKKFFDTNYNVIIMKNRI